MELAIFRRATRHRGATYDALSAIRISVCAQARDAFKQAARPFCMASPVARCRCPRVASWSFEDTVSSLHPADRRAPWPSPRPPPGSRVRPRSRRPVGRASIGKDRDARNRLQGTVEPPAPGDIADVPAEGTPEHARCREAGLAALRRGRGRPLRPRRRDGHPMGGVVKALVEVLPGRAFLDLRLAESDHLRRTTGSRSRCG